jgi:WhiB family redox-sensing transcriptional regulator
MPGQFNTPLVSRRVVPKGVVYLYDNDHSFDNTWREEASCRNQDLTIFFPPSNRIINLSSASQALRICHNCPVSHFCLYEAMKYNYDGIWGNTIYKQRIHFVRTELDNNLDNLTLDKAREFVQTTKIENVPILARSGRKNRLKLKDSSNELS